VKGDAYAQRDRAGELTPSRRIVCINASPKMIQEALE
jgi:hypothetical protein